MNANHKSWIPVLVLVCLMLQTPKPAHAFVLSFGGSPHDPAAVRSSAADVLYATLIWSSRGGAHTCAPVNSSGRCRSCIRSRWPDFGVLRGGQG
jgi:hypothetical protein